jgi:hypothetical protein
MVRFSVFRCGCGIKRGFPRCLRGPLGLSPTVVSEDVKPIIYSYASEYVKIIHEDNLSYQNEIITDAIQSHVAPGTISESDDDDDDDDETETTTLMSI